MLGYVKRKKKKYMDIKNSPYGFGDGSENCKED